MIQSRIFRHAHIETMTAIAHRENAAFCKRLIESSNRSFGQHIRYQVARQLRIMAEMAK